ncbi:hypothetical protein [Novosphingobium colocasiae]|uniref:hypothetical protein n=1 Tax=Novosphingobium colocasiae TaxID=1256513 RepID=UPI0035AF057F
MTAHPIPRRMLLAALGTLALSGCLSTAKSIVTAPVKVAGKSVDLMTTSQSEADEKRGRNMRHREERLDDVEKSYARHMRQCQNGNEDACYTARTEYGEIQNLRASLPPR